MWTGASGGASLTTATNMHGQMCIATAGHRAAARDGTRSHRRAQPPWARAHACPGCTNAHATPPKACTPQSTHTSHTRGCNQPTHPHTHTPSTHPQKGRISASSVKKKRYLFLSLDSILHAGINTFIVIYLQQLQINKGTVNLNRKPNTWLEKALSSLGWIFLNTRFTPGRGGKAGSASGYAQPREITPLPIHGTPQK